MKLWVFFPSYLFLYPQTPINVKITIIAKANKQKKVGSF